MKKVILTVALGTAILAPAFAAGGANEITAGLPFQVHDYIELSPHGAFPANDISLQFTTPQQMADGLAVDPDGEFTITASRSWKVMYSASDFERIEAPEDNISQTLPVDQILQVAATTTDPFVTGTTLHFASTGGDLLASGMGGTSRKYLVSGRVTPGNVFTTHNMSGSYVSEVMQVASLD